MGMYLFSHAVLAHFLGTYVFQKPSEFIKHAFSKFVRWRRKQEVIRQIASRRLLFTIYEDMIYDGPLFFPTLDFENEVDDDEEMEVEKLTFEGIPGELLSPDQAPNKKKTIYTEEIELSDEEDMCIRSEEVCSCDGSIDSHTSIIDDHIVYNSDVEWKDLNDDDSSTEFDLSNGIEKHTTFTRLLNYFSFQSNSTSSKNATV